MKRKLVSSWIWQHIPLLQKTTLIPVPLDATDFYKGLDEHVLKRDNMYFLPNQVNEYDIAHIKTDVENIQFSLFVTNEKTAMS